MKVKFSIWYVLLFVSFSAFAQHTTLEGTVTDEAGNSLEMANVIALITESGKMESYSVTNDQGKFKIILPQNQTYTIKVSYLGFTTEVLTYTTPAGNQTKTQNFKLKEKSDQLNEVELKYTMPITIKGDTIVYNADSFTTGNEKKLEDVLEKLPGVEVNDEGQVEVEGKEVSKVMVNGKNFFEGDTKLAVKNIPANAVDKVEVLKNYSEVNQLKGLENDQDAIALNIKLKQGKENFWFGEITAGGGAEKNYLVHPKVFYYSPKKSLNILTDFNNIGQAPFTIRDYFKFSGGLSNFMRKGGSSVRLNSDQLGISLINNDKLYTSIDRFAAVNFNYSFSKVFDISTFAIFSDSDTRMKTDTYRNYTATEVEEYQQNRALQSNQFAMVKFRSTYKPSDKLTWNYNAIVKKSKQNDVNNTVSSINNNIDTDQRQDPFGVNQTTDFYYTLNEKHILTSSLQHTLDQNNPAYNALSAEEFFEKSALLNMQPDAWYDLTQDKSINTNKLDFKLDYFYLLNAKSNLNFTLGNTYLSQKLESDMFQTLSNGTTYHFDNTVLQNDAAFKSNDVFLALRYNLKHNKWSITPGFSVHHFGIDDTQFGTAQKQSLYKLLPTFYTEYQFKQSRSMRFEYGITSEFSDINRYATGLLLNSYQSLSGGSRDLKNMLNHSYTLSYFDFNMYNFTNLSLFATYQKSMEAVKFSTQLVENESVSYPVNSLYPDESFTGRINGSKKIKKFDFTVSSTWMYGLNHNFLNNVQTLSKSLTQSYSFDVGTRFKQWPNFNMGYGYSVNNYTGTNRNSKYVTQKPYIKTEANFLKNFTWTADYTFYNYEDRGLSTGNTYSFLNSKLYYQKEKSKWEFILSGNNILGKGSQNTNYSSDILISTTRYHILPPIYMLSVKYDI